MRNAAGSASHTRKVIFLCKKSKNSSASPRKWEVVERRRSEKSCSVGGRVKTFFVLVEVIRRSELKFVKWLSRIIQGNMTSVYRFRYDIKLTWIPKGYEQQNKKKHPKIIFPWKSFVSKIHAIPHNTSIISLFIRSGNNNCFCSHSNHKFAVTN